MKKKKVKIDLKEHDMNLYPKKDQSVFIGKCPNCNNLITDTSFKDMDKLREFSISGLCVKCQKKKK